VRHTITDHSVALDVCRGDAERRVLVVLVAVDAELPVVATSGESDCTEHHSLVEAAARYRRVVVGEQHVVVSRPRVQTEPRHCSVPDNQKFYSGPMESTCVLLFVWAASLMSVCFSGSLLFER